MSNKLMTRLEVLNELIERDRVCKHNQQKLNDDIGKFISDDLGFGKNPATLCDIVKRALETSVDESRIIKP